MWQKLRLVVLAAVLGVAGYFLLSYHVVFFGKSLKLLKKGKLTSEYTFISVGGKNTESILQIDTLREAGIGSLLVEMGMLSEEEKEALEEKFKSDPVYY